MEHPYYTVKQATEEVYIIQKSKFISHIFHIEEEAEALSHIEAIRKTHWKANHNCFAYVIGETSHIQKASDDGEPSGTAGVPILEVIKKQHLRDTLVVVTRYFGGIKLGAGGLIRAYSTSTSIGIEAAGIIERVPVSLFTVSFDYPLWGAVQNALSHSPYILNQTTYTDKITLEIAVRSSDINTFEPWITNLCNGQNTLTHLRDDYIEVDHKKD
ncbi:YigZ family protein [Pullulanibacillus sp. KACC 23026]|uniref:YigZ family protein n=1 Tax=Pullulanibacillus sp. KACC 23026 TaxID=3028315 RepID=UPI0023B1A7BD|nr:YigZ family protein [Pullulanibacillus sp. KACC 23026]WEG13590.1 YigZ family protein [Pullulanibacillus sp. KACC 23026]